MFKPRSILWVNIFVALFIVIFDNASFFSHVLEVYPLSAKYAPFLLSQVVVFFLFLVLFLSLITWRKLTKPLLITILLIAAAENYFMQTYNVLIDETMIENTIQTDVNEAMDLMSLKLLIYMVLLGILPSFIVYKIPLIYTSFTKEIFTKVKVIVLTTLLMFAVIIPFSKHYTSFFREHRILRFYTNPTHGLFSLGVYIKKQFINKNKTLLKIGEDATIAPHERKKIIIMVVGEATRADHLSLNGYKRETNPLLSKENIINFSQMYSCGTTTAVSVPCMFSVYNKSEYSTQKGLYTQNVLDVLNRAGVEVLWRDNNSNSKGVADRLNYLSYKTATVNTMCDGECRDVGMLVGLDKKIENSTKDMIIVLHQMGNHGPAYYKRYPKSFEHFVPTCKTNQLEECTQEEISNAYDNALRYSDYFLAKTIGLLKKYEDRFDVAMFYMADHGESLGEGGLYLHGIPYFIAPDSQIHVGSLMWLGDGIAKSENIEKRFTQDYLFSTLLGYFDVNTTVYKKELDIFESIR